MAIPARHVHRDSDINFSPNHAMGRTIHFRKRIVQARLSFQRVDHGPRRQMRVADLALAVQLAHLVQQSPVFVNHLHGNGALRGRGRHAEARDHVLRHAHGSAAQRHQLIGAAQGHRGSLLQHCGSVCSRCGIRLLGDWGSWDCGLNLGLDLILMGDRNWSWDSGAGRNCRAGRRRLGRFRWGWI